MVQKAMFAAKQLLGWPERARVVATARQHTLHLSPTCCAPGLLRGAGKASAAYTVWDGHRTGLRRTASSTAEFKSHHHPHRHRVCPIHPLQGLGGAASCLTLPTLTWLPLRTLVGAAVNMIGRTATLRWKRVCCGVCVCRGEKAFLVVVVAVMMASG